MVLESHIKIEDVDYDGKDNNIIENDIKRVESIEVLDSIPPLIPLKQSMSINQYERNKSIDVRSRSRCATSSKNEIRSNPQQQPSISISKVPNIQKRKLESIIGELGIGNIKDKLQLRLDKKSNFDLKRNKRCDGYQFPRDTFGSQGYLPQGNKCLLM